MRICFIVEYYHPHIGGVEYLFKQLAEGLSKRDHDVRVLTRRLKGTPKHETIGGVAITRVRTWNRYFFSFLSIPKALTLTKACDVIHTTTFNGAFPAWVASRVRGIPAVITILEVWIDKWGSLTDMNRWSSALHNFLEKLIYLLKFDCYLAISHSTERQLKELGIPEGRIRTIYPGFDPAFFNPNGIDGDTIRKQHDLGDAFICFSWGRPGVSKGHEYFLRAVPSIVKKIPRAKLILMLSNRDTYAKRHRYLIRSIQKLGIGDRVLLVEPAPREVLRQYLKAADCVVIPSLAEGFGYAVLEACAMGRPVVASNTTSIPEVIGGKYVLVEPKNPEAIAAGVAKIYRGEYEMSALKFFPWERTLAECESVYKKLAGEAAPASS